MRNDPGPYVQLTENTAIALWHRLLSLGSLE